ncbi:acyl-CoA dehydrogenase family protein [Occultella gossypii]|uniref:Acyl-CoA dehydrogenase family protein n=1 Tax=Occultella gossypii TaxID=2800820 RepID=A0ABS7S8B9_9MICO|nr:acyl-CoA dehydrogenase family protein [Occultella gossypii]MBZ2195521.1 acyl-CoA dehydrogenase family protein [Occultella gossypii]
MISGLEEFIRTDVAPRAQEIDRDATIPPELVGAAAALGLQRILAGPGGRPDATRIEEACEVSQAIAAHSPAVALAIAGTRLTTYLLGKYAPAHLVDRWLEPTLAGRTFGSFAITEPHAGTDIRGMSTVAELDGDRYILNGGKCWVGFAPVADFAIVLAKVGSTDRDAPMVALVVDMASAGASGRPGPELSGFRGMPNGELTFTDVSVPATDRLGVEGFAGMMDGLNMARIDAAAYACGLLRGALVASLERANGRAAFGRPLADLAIIQRKIGRIATDYHAARALTQRAARSFADGTGGDQDLISMAKMFSSDAARRATDEAMQIHGALGIVTDEPVNRMHRDAKVTQIFDGTSEIHETMLGRRALRAQSAGRLVPFVDDEPAAELSAPGVGGRR